MRLLVLIVSVAAFAAACGSGDTVDTATGDDETDTTIADGADDGDDAEADTDGEDDQDEGDDSGLPPVDDEEGPAPDPVVEDDAGYEPTTAMDELLDPQAHPIDEVVVSDDGMTLGVRYQSSTEPCSGARATVVEDADAVSVSLESGLNPDAASMSCIQQIVAYELAVPLAAPLGERDLAFDATAGSDTGGDDGADDGEADESDDEGDGMSDGALSGPEAFVGLSLDAASALADQEGRAWRISRQDGEEFLLTQDFDPDRVNFEVDAGTVTAVATG